MTPNENFELKVTVVMAVYNGCRYLKEQLDSVLADLCANDEIVIVDDASTDGSAQLIGSYSDQRIRYVRNQVNMGVRKTFERGLELAEKDVLFLCDQDDVWMLGKRKAVINVFANQQQCALVVHDAEVIDAKGNLTHASFMNLRGGFESAVFYNIVRNRYLGCAMAFRASLRHHVLPIPADVPMHDMWIGIRLRMIGSVEFLPIPLIRYRRHGGNVSPMHRQALWQMITWRWQLFSALVRRALGTE
jgi:hypothetical protein